MKNAIEKAQRIKAQLAAKYNVPQSSIVWAGGDRYIVVKDGVEIWVPSLTTSGTVWRWLYSPNAENLP